MDKIKNIYLVIILIIVIIIAIGLSIVKAASIPKDTIAKVEKHEQEGNQKAQNEAIVVDIETEENVQEIFDEEGEEKNQANQEQKNQAKYYIKINYTQNVVTIYEKDSGGSYTKPVKVMVCSTGRATPRSGTYSISDKYKWGRLNGGVSGQYCTRIVKSILFHSVPYITYGDKGSLEYWEYDKLGTTASAGCIRLTVQDAKWIYQNCERGTQVEFYSDSNPGPLGKPSAQKISEEEAVRGWDPTDPDENNPWKTYIKEEEKIEESQKPEIEKEDKTKPEVTDTPITKPEGTDTPTTKPEKDENAESKEEEVPDAPEETDEIDKVETKPDKPENPALPEETPDEENENPEKPIIPEEDPENDITNIPKEDETSEQEEA